MVDYEGKAAVSSASFEVQKRKIITAQNILITIIVIIAILIILAKIGKKEKENKKTEQEEKRELAKNRK
jgi:heme/copper-type cytochrome/quinol oxidase subunit 2